MSNHRRFYIEESIVQGQPIKMTGALASQIVSVLRLGSGDRVTLFDGSGAEFESLIKSTSTSCVCADVISCTFPDAQLPFELVAAIGRSKPARMELIIQKCTELGVSRFIVLECAHSIGESPDEKKAARWRKIAIEAVEQCGGTKIPDITFGTTMNDLSAIIPEMDIALLAHEQEKSLSLVNALIERESQWDKRPRISLSDRRIMFISGPEGGFREDEVDLLTRAGVTTISLGKRILRAETAAIAGCSAIAMFPWS